MSESILRSHGAAPSRTLRYGDHPDQLVDVRDAAGPGAPLVIVVHGGYWRPGTDRTHAGRMSDALAAAGLRVATLEYRRVPGDPDASVADVLAGVRAAIADAGAVAPVLLGHSAGGHLALLVATAPDLGLGGVVALAPVADLALAERLGAGEGAVPAFLGGSAASRPDLDPALLPAPAAPVRVLHGDADDVVAVAISEGYVARHPSADLLLIPGADHFTLIDPESADWPRVVSAVTGTR